MDKVFHCWMTEGTNDLSNKDVLRGRVKQLSCICKTGPGFDSTSPEISKIYLSQTKLNISRNTHQYNIYILVSNYRCRYHIFNSWSNAWEKLILNEKRLKNRMIYCEIVRWKLARSLNHYSFGKYKHNINTCIAAYYHWTNNHKHELSIVIKNIPSTNEQWVKVRKKLWNEKVKKHLVNYGVFSSSSVIKITNKQMCGF